MSSVRAQRNNNIQPVPSTDRPTMSKGTRFVTFAVPAVIAYFLLLLHVLPTPFLAQETADQILPVIPWWLLVAFGAYSLSSLGLGLLRFHDTPEAYQSLLGEIQQAKNELRDQGVEVD
ncbi:hypothetical protein A1Q1_03616 [Trichosporon asahii var. asahii CBS 2479]|uniref:Dolichol-phosphate mannosyltransferase subunit 3 n=1 Tax=Trichosporon asahii var. asahii (strain ATCC 90039 / CBS 2479 / JCM 2466 / KCTC 7840 / NBRC 103889/ NCYC 2677 / UAMH 7654) TaxID=1186058 RepID=J6ESK5_TRIAS|nr:hypothetical protein A1Q1_03616 [Trichosporon asahii var. asahii CBS 2479]EJT47504.1 hypothetical protein A1Q1_03616 [Trichosporon asahii var. asahii CBS 2479]